MRLAVVVCTAGALALGPAVAPPARAAEPVAGPKFNVMGPSTCAGWPKMGAITTASRAVPLNWVLGFLSGWAAQANIALLDVIEPEAVADWLTAYCQANPTAALPVAARQLERELEAKLPKPEPPPPPMFIPIAPKADAPATKPKPKAKAPVRRKKPAAANAK